MNKTRTKVAVLLATAAIVGSLTVASPAYASVGVNMNLACQVTLQIDGAAGKLEYPSQGVYGWRCWNRGNPLSYYFGPYYSVNVQKYCSNEYGLNAHFSNVNNAYSWYCS